MLLKNSFSPDIVILAVLFFTSLSIAKFMDKHIHLKYLFAGITMIILSIMFFNFRIYVLSTYLKEVSSEFIVENIIGLLGISATYTVVFSLLRRLKRDRDRYKNMSITDSLTGLYALSHIFSLGSDMLLKGSDIAAIVIDLDGFKHFNDTYGHLAGDKVLIQVGSFLKKETEPYKGIVGRLGGDEFVILFENSPSSAIEKLQNIIQIKMAKEPLFTADEQLCNVRIPCSIGFSTSVENAIHSVEEVLHNADSNMYYNKFHKTSIELSPLDYDYLLHEDAQILLKTISEKDMYTYVHSQNVANYSVMIAKKLGLDKDFIKDIFIAGWVHDLGKIFVPNEILRKKGKLSDEEYEIIKNHVDYGLKIVKELNLSETVLNATIFHHERFDGKGYPGNIKGSSTPIEGRILQVADSFSAMTIKRVYREPVHLDKALDELKKYCGSQFDPLVVDAFIDAIKERCELNDVLS